MSHELLRHPVQALALDVDGTLADTDPIHGAAWARALEKVNGRSFSVWRYIESCITGLMSPRDFVAEFSQPDELDEIERQKRLIYPTMLTGNVALTPGLAQFLRQVDAAGLEVAIVSSSSRSSVDALLDNLWESRMPAVIVARGDATSPKPDAAPYLAALHELKLTAGSVVAFEDSPSGIASATAAGLLSIGVGSATGGTTELLISDFTQCHIERESEAAGSWLIINAP